jgi:hypothetical protein
MLLPVVLLLQAKARVTFLLRLLHEQQQLRPAKVRPDCNTSAAALLCTGLLLLLLLVGAAVLLPGKVHTVITTLLLLLLLLRHSCQHCPAERVQVSTAAGQLDSKHTALGSKLNAQLNKRHPTQLQSSSSSGMPAGSTSSSSRGY